MIALRASRVATAEGARTDTWVTIEDGLIAAVGPEPPARARRVVLADLDLIPGLVDLHSDCLDERVRLRPTSHQPIEAALLQLDAEAAAHGVTTHFICASFEDDPVGHRSTEGAVEIVETVTPWRELLRVDARIHLRYELTSEGLELASRLAGLGSVGIVSYMDHSPGHGQFATEAQWRAWYARRFDGDEQALDDLIIRRRGRQAGIEVRRSELAALAHGVSATLASHDDETCEDIELAVGLGARIAEFPVSASAAAAATEAGLGVVMGAPNAQRGGSHMNGLSARDALSAGHLDALASDYHPPSLLNAAYQLAADGACTWADAVSLVSAGPARLAGLDDRGRIAPGLRADLAAVSLVGGRPVVRQLWVGGRPALGSLEAAPARAAARSAAKAPAVEVRPATWADRMAIRALVESMGGHEDVAARPGTDAAIASVLELPTARLLVAEDGAGAVCGYVEMQSRPGTLHGEREAWIAGLGVDPAARDQGIGGRLLDAAQREAALLGCGELVLESAIGRSAAHRFYRANGFEDAIPAVRLRAPVRCRDEAPLEERFLVAAARAATAIATVLPACAQRLPVRGGFDTDDKATDLEAERLALEILERLGVPIVSEESGVIGRLPHPREAWISLDPLDGTRNCMHGMRPWALSVGLVRDGRPLAGLVLDLSCGQRWWAGTPEGARVDGRRLRPRSGGLLLLPSTPPAELGPVVVPEGFERARLVGSTAIDLCRVADGTAGGFRDLSRAVSRVHDIAGAMALLRAAGATILTADGHPPQLVPDPDVRYLIVAAATEHEARMLLELSGEHANGSPHPSAIPERGA